MSVPSIAELEEAPAPVTGDLFRSVFRDHAARVVFVTDAFLQHLLPRLGNQQAIDNARMASTDLSRRRVEREAVDLFLERLHVSRVGATDDRLQARTGW